MSKRTPLQQKTIDSFKKVGNNVYSLVYANDYGLDTMLKKGIKSTGGLLKFAVDYMRISRKKYQKNKNADFACTSFNAFTPNGEHIMGRNFDYLEAPLIVVWSQPENYYKSIAVANCTFMLFGKSNIYPLKKSNEGRLLLAPYCCMEGMNEKGLTIAVLEIKTKPTKQQTGKKPITTTTIIRTVLDKCATVDEAINEFAKYDMHDAIWTNYHFHIIDANGKSAIIEYVNNKMCVHTDKYQRLTNFFISKDGDNSKGFGKDRFNYAKTEVEAHNGTLSEQEAMQMLDNLHLDFTHKRGYQVITLWSSVFNANAKTLRLSASLDYGTAYNFSIDKPGEWIEEKTEKVTTVSDFNFAHKDSDY